MHSCPAWSFIQHLQTIVHWTIPFISLFSINCRVWGLVYLTVWIMTFFNQMKEGYLAFPQSFYYHFRVCFKLNGFICCKLECNENSRQFMNNVCSMKPWLQPKSIKHTAHAWKTAHSPPTTEQSRESHSVFILLQRPGSTTEKKINIAAQTCQWERIENAGRLEKH